MDFFEANKYVHPVQTQWHWDVMVAHGFKPITKEDVGFVRAYHYEDDKGNKISCHTGVNADYWRNDQTNDGGYYGSLREYLINLK